MSQKTARNIAIIAVVLVLAAVAVSAWATAERYAREESYRTASLCLDYEQFASVAAQWPQGALSYWKEMKDAGATSVAVGELTIGWMEDAGYIEIIKLPARDANVGHLIKPIDPKSGDILTDRLTARLGAMAEVVPGGVQVYGLTNDQLRAMNAGPDEYAIELMGEAGLDVVLRLSAFGGFDSDWVELALSDELEAGTVVIFSEKQVGGFPNRLEEVSEALVAEGALIGQVEFSKQLGSDELDEFMMPNIVRVHSITPEELAKGMLMEDAIVRFARAVRERSMRLIYVNPYRFAGEDLDIPQYNLEYVKGIAGAIVELGYALGKVSVPDQASGPELWLLLKSTAIGSSAALYLIIMPFGPMLALALALASALFQVALSLFLPESLGSSLIPLAAAVIMPCLGAAAWMRIMRFCKGSALVKALGAWAAASVISVSGGLMLSSPVADVARMLGVGVFTGVKVAQVLPLLLAFAGFWALMLSKKGGRGLMDEALGLGMQPIRWWHAAVVGIAGAVGLYMVLRSGNASPALVTGFEAAAREALEKLLVFRPRSKEVFVGHPAMIIAGLLFADGFAGLSLAAFVLGMVGQVSMANTFMHLHTPIAATAIRTALGLILGFAAGLAAIVIYRAALKAIRKRWPNI